jgi:hypothetical protein
MRGPSAEYRCWPSSTFSVLFCKATISHHIIEPTDGIIKRICLHQCSPFAFWPWAELREFTPSNCSLTQRHRSHGWRVVVIEFSVLGIASSWNFQFSLFTPGAQDDHVGRAITYLSNYKGPRRPPVLCFSRLHCLQLSHCCCSILASEYSQTCILDSPSHLRSSWR